MGEAYREARESAIGDRIIVRDGDRFHLLDVGEIDWIEADDYRARIHASGATYRLRETLANLESSLQHRDFLRIHRSAIVNLKKIRELRRGFNGTFVVRLESGTELSLSRRRRRRLDDFLGRTL